MGYGEEDDELNCTLWVGNLDPNVTESALFEIFVQGGPIQKIHIPRGKDNGHKGYCFITFQHNESVPYSMNVLDGTWLCGKLLRLQPRPGSRHKKLMDAAKEGDQRQLTQLPPQLQVPVPAAQAPLPPHLLPPQQHQWYLAPQGMSQFPNLVVYPSQMFQTYSPCVPNLNNGMGSTLIQLPGGMTQVIPYPLQSQQVPHSLTQEHLPPPTPPHQTQPQYSTYSQSPRGVRPMEFRPRPRNPHPVVNGYSGSTLRQSNGGNKAQIPSQYTQSQVLNGSHSQSVRFPQQASNRGPRPQGQRPQLHNTQGNPRNCNNDNGNITTRPPFSHRTQAQLPPTFQTSPPLIYGTTPVYRHQHSNSLQYHGQPLTQADRHLSQRPPFPPSGDLYTY